VIPTQLILVEGLPGSGKSTTAQQLCLHLRRLGRRARWVYENETPHPILPALDPQRLWQLDGDDPDRAWKAALSGWRVFASAVAASDEIAIVESAFFQMTIGPQLLQNLPAEAIAGHVLEASRSIEPLSPVLIHLRPADVGAALRKIAARRGEWFEQFLVKQIAASPCGRQRGIADFAGVIALFESLRGLIDSVCEKLAMPRLTLDPSDDDWPRHREAITRFLSLPPFAEDAPPAGAERLTGRYRRADSQEEFTVSSDSGGLFFDDKARTRLIPMGSRTFCIQGMCVDLTFATDDRGEAPAVELSGPLRDLPQTWRKV
jgi:hypothetical protein